VGDRLLTGAKTKEAIDRPAVSAGGVKGHPWTKVAVDHTASSLTNTGEEPHQ
jgi:hypothetical protein